MLSATATVTSLNSTVTLTAGDNITVPAGSTLTALNGTITLNSADTAADAAGSIISQAGDLDAQRAFFIGADQNDVFNVKPDDDTPIDVDGQPPTFALPLGLVPPGDTLNMDFGGLTNPPTLIVGVPGNGGF